VLTPAEFQALVQELPLRERAAVMLAGSTGLRRSELFALRWGDVNFFTMEVGVTRSCVRNHFGETKTEASRKPVPLHDMVRDVLAEWRGASMYKPVPNSSQQNHKISTCLLLASRLSEETACLEVPYCSVPWFVGCHFLYAVNPSI